MKGFVHSIESFGSVDGPGIRFLIFLQGCPMRCQFCHNPDSWKTGVGEEWSADDLLDKAERFKSYWGDKGGITVSGGEALMQIDFLIELFEKAHQRGSNLQFLGKVIERIAHVLHLLSLLEPFPHLGRVLLHLSAKSL